MNQVTRILVEKKHQFDVEKEKLLAHFHKYLEIKGITDIRLINCYDIEGLAKNDIAPVANNILSEVNTDDVAYEEIDLNGANRIFRFMPLPGQFDLRSASAIQCINALLADGKTYNVESSRIVALYGDIDDEALAGVKSYFINPVDSMDAPVGKPLALMKAAPAEDDTQPLHGFNELTAAQLRELRTELRLSLTEADLLFIQKHFKEVEKRVPTHTEIRVLDVYWSDHCRHTTFNTEIKHLNFDHNNLDALQKAYDEYMEMRKDVYGEEGHAKRPVTLMDLAVIAAKYQKKHGRLADLEVSDEINAASIRVPVTLNTSKGKEVEDYLVMFKNETHNHPTEIEPFGGASTCLGGAIRDPLSGRSYVYHSMRVTGSGDPRKSLKETLKGKLPQRKITTEAAKGFSAYGNQIGLATGHVSEIYHEGYVAKRMEVGAVIGAAPESQVVRKKPEAGDKVIMIGGRTGRDGCGGASGSSVEHTEKSLLTCGAEVQKGNAPEERKLQRLFRNPDFSVLVKKCNDFGAGGVSVAIGEMADSIDVYLDRVPKKYEGLTGTELAISESQERMAVMVSAEDVEKVLAFSAEENLEATVVADVTDSGRLRMFFDNRAIIDISRDFLDTNGASLETNMAFGGLDLVKENPFKFAFKSSADDHIVEVLKNLNVCSQRGLVELFDQSVGANTVVQPYGGKHQLTPAHTMVARIPSLKGISETVSMMAYGFDPIVSSWSPFHGAYYSVLQSIARLVATGADRNTIRLTFQEYFEKLGNDPIKWGKPFSSLLGANTVLKAAGLAAVGGKDSMSGTFNDIHVPPTLISFAVSTAHESAVVTPEFKGGGTVLGHVFFNRNAEALLNLEEVFAAYDAVHALMAEGSVKSAVSVGFGGIAAAALKSVFGNGVGITLDVPCLSTSEEVSYITESRYGDLLLELDAEAVEALRAKGVKITEIGKTCDTSDVTIFGKKYRMEELIAAWEAPLAEVFPTLPTENHPLFNDILTYESTSAMLNQKVEDKKFQAANVLTGVGPKVVVPVFPGTNCEYDTANAFRRAGAEAEIVVFGNLNAEMFQDSIRRLEKAIKEAQILALPGGFSAGDEPDGSGKYIASVLRNATLTDAIHDLLKNRDGLVTGICNGFQVLVKLGLVTYGEIRDLDVSSPTLTYNAINRHQAKMVNVKIGTAQSPWLSGLDRTKVYKTPISHGEGRFLASDEALKTLIAQNQLATFYTDLEGNLAKDQHFNPNSSIASIEGIVSPDGRVFGKMGHTERVLEGLYRNVPDVEYMDFFSSGVRYFKG